MKFTENYFQNVVKIAGAINIKEIDNFKDDNYIIDLGSSF
jgi:hypothetical protein|tara:strand:+ start:167 stop:286 length:120 start_codon:yes stop_codon:yes gene_type:complete